MTLQILKELSGLWSVLAGIGMLIAFGTWIKTSLLSLEKRVILLEKQFDILNEKEVELQAQIIGRLTRIETMLETRPCVLGRDTVRRGFDCD